MYLIFVTCTLENASTQVRNTFRIFVPEAKRRYLISSPSYSTAQMLFLSLQTLASVQLSYFEHRFLSSQLLCAHRRMIGVRWPHTLTLISNNSSCTRCEVRWTHCSTCSTQFLPIFLSSLGRVCTLIHKVELPD